MTASWRADKTPSSLIRPSCSLIGTDDIQPLLISCTWLLVSWCVFSIPIHGIWCLLALGARLRLRIQIEQFSLHMHAHTDLMKPTLQRLKPPQHQHALWAFFLAQIHTLCWHGSTPSSAPGSACRWMIYLALCSLNGSTNHECPAVSPELIFAQRFLHPQL